MNFVVQNEMKRKNKNEVKKNWPHSKLRGLVKNLNLNNISFKFLNKVFNFRSVLFN